MFKYTEVNNSAFFQEKSVCKVGEDPPRFILLKWCNEDVSSNITATGFIARCALIASFSFWNTPPIGISLKAGENQEWLLH